MSPGSIVIGLLILIIAVCCVLFTVQTVNWTNSKQGEQPCSIALTIFWFHKGLWQQVALSMCLYHFSMAHSLLSRLK